MEQHYINEKTVGSYTCPCSRFVLPAEAPAIPRKRVGGKPVPCYNQKDKSKFAE